MNETNIIVAVKVSAFEQSVGHLGPPVELVLLGHDGASLAGEVHAHGDDCEASATAGEERRPALLDHS